jgi:NAD(P)-dependent dehydrogenase (short-subunit alcohol dehydrogenase family)
MIMDRLKGKRALITGGTTGIGLETARRFVEESARVIVTGTNPATLEAARNTLGEGALVLSSDAGVVADQRKLAQTVKEHFGQLDVLFLNAGIAQLQPMEQWTEEAFDRSFAINVKGPFFLVQALLPIFSNRASIVLNGSVNAHIGMANTTVYAATKASLISLVRTLSGELLGRGIRANAVSPGPITTPLYGKLGIAEADLKKVADSVQSKVPLGRFGTPREIADAVVFFASDESGFAVASELLIDGGMSAI